MTGTAPVMPLPSLGALGKSQLMTREGDNWSCRRISIKFTELGTISKDDQVSNWVELFILVGENGIAVIDCGGN